MVACVASMPQLLNNAGRKAGVSYLCRKARAAKLPGWKPFAGMAGHAKQGSQGVEPDCGRSGAMLSRPRADGGQILGWFNAADAT